MRILPLLAAALLLAPLAPARADDAAAKKLRAGLPAVEEAGGWRFWGELWQGVRWMGTLRLELKASAHDESPAWLATETVQVLGEKTPLDGHAAFTLGRDLSLLAATWGGEAGGATTDGALKRKGTGLEWQGTVTREGQAPTALALGAAPAAGGTGGLCALVTLARTLCAAKSSAKGLEVAWLDGLSLLPGEAKPLHGAHTLEVLGAGKLDVLPDGPATWSLRGKSASGERAFTVHLDPSGERVLGLETPTWTVLPTGTRPAALKFDEQAPARTWQDAFLTFGVGYHMAKKALLERAFHWQTMYDYETSLVDGWPAEKPLADFREAWVQEFLNQSKHRTPEETFGLLNGTMGTGKLKVKTPDLVVLAAVAQFGGGIQRTYHLRRFDGVWYLTRIDSAE